jgi:hypothetical protein
MGLLLAHAAIAMMVRSWPWAIPTPRSLFTMYRRSSSRSPIRLLLPVEMDAGRQKALEQVCATAQNDAVQSVELKADNLEAKSSPAQQSYNLHIGACNQKRKQDVTSPDRVANLYRVSVSTKASGLHVSRPRNVLASSTSISIPTANDASKRSRPHLSQPPFIDCLSVDFLPAVFGNVASSDIRKKTRRRWSPGPIHLKR